MLKTLNKWLITIWANSMKPKIMSVKTEMLVTDEKITQPRKIMSPELDESRSVTCVELEIECCSSAT